MKIKVEKLSPEELVCTWNVLEPVRKHCRFT
jgi:uncharacterized cupin superfamily protein